MQTGSTRAFSEVGWTCQLSPRSAVVQTTRPVRRLLRMLSIRRPSPSSATAHSVVWEAAGAEVCHVRPRSVLYMMPEKGIPALSRPWVGKTRIPSRVTIPRPGAGAKSHHSGRLTEAVMFRGADQVRPSSELSASRNWHVR